MTSKFAAVKQAGSVVLGLALGTTSLIVITAGIVSFIRDPGEAMLPACLAVAAFAVISWFRRQQERRDPGAASLRVDD
ncbi:hypothetical protein [Aeromicrobium choanae]|uniref:Uncharacterized protein n=1 Tax=Aeromicrobium choanae TaxID=1736691 RepID=A0A1T4YPN1_9ACTN|nr:hypothetical protein [Aeromicrobium choanae]SKB03653.1 hypothetical protein SAMN06295964_0305 [Aeromicrobium choanae]